MDSGTATADTEAPAVPTGYSNEDTYYATRYSQGRRTVYAIDLSLMNVAAMLPRPDPDKPTPGNRRVKDAHARGFAAYIRGNENWVSPALILRAPDVFKFTPERVVGGTEFGVLAIPRLARNDLKILDGQHRILGVHYGVDQVDAEIDKVRSLIAAAKRDGNGELETHHRKELSKLEKQRQRFSTERISVQVQIEEDQREFMQMFVDIADNALGISSAIRARFDARKVVNRSLEDVLKNALLTERVDLEQDRIGVSSRFFLGAKHVADIVRTATVGVSGRIGKRQEDELDEAMLVEKSNNFMDLLVGGFSILDDLVEGKTTPEDVRKTSLLGSATMLRVLAGVYYDLSKDMSDDEIQEFFEKLNPFMSAPIKDGSPWLETGVFSVGATAPKARRQDMKTLTETIAKWAKYPPAWLEGNNA
jgi:hypothetical protein